MRRIVHVVVDFVVGDDVWIAVAVLLLLACTAALVRLGGDAWWLLTTGVPASLWISLRRVRRQALAAPSGLR